MTAGLLLAIAVSAYMYHAVPAHATVINEEYDCAFAILAWQRAQAILADEANAASRNRTLYDALQLSSCGVPPPPASAEEPWVPPTYPTPSGVPCVFADAEHGSDATGSDARRRESCSTNRGGVCIAEAEGIAKGRRRTQLHRRQRG